MFILPRLRVMGRTMHYCNHCDYKSNRWWDVNRHSIKKHPYHASNNDAQRETWGQQNLQGGRAQAFYHQPDQVRGIICLKKLLSYLLAKGFIPTVTWTLLINSKKLVYHQKKPSIMI